MAGSGAWPVRVHRLSEMASGLALELAAQLRRDEDPLSIVYVPADPRMPASGSMRARTRGDQALVLTPRRLLAGAEAVDPDQPHWCSFPYESIIAWSVTESLLYGCFEVAARAEGRLARAAFEFNTVGRVLVEEALAPLDRAVLGQSRRPGAGWPPPRDIPGLPLKFGSYLAHTLLPTEQVRRVLFEPAVTRRVWKIVTRLVHPAQLFVATDLRVAVIREEEQLKSPRYGYSAWTVPRRSAGELECIEEGGSLFLTLRSAPTAMRVLLSPEKRKALKELLGVATLDDIGSLPHPTIH